jgi:hypothetical protein
MAYPASNILGIVGLAIGVKTGGVWGWGYISSAEMKNNEHYVSAPPPHAFFVNGLTVEAQGKITFFTLNSFSCKWRF